MSDVFEVRGKSARLTDSDSSSATERTLHENTTDTPRLQNELIDLVNHSTPAPPFSNERDEADLWNRGIFTRFRSFAFSNSLSKVRQGSCQRISQVC